MNRSDNPSADAQTVMISIPRDSGCAARARDAVRDRLVGRAGLEELETAVLVTSELVTNAWKHGEGGINLRMTVATGHVRLEVIDEGSGQTPRIRPEDGDASGGWGLRLVEDLSLRWGAFEGTTHVWAELPLTPEA